MEQVQLITKDMTIGNFADNYPKLVNILMAEGVHCVGCGASTFETIEEGLLSHGKTLDEIFDVVSRLNKALEENKDSSNNESVIITEKAASKLKEILKSQNKEGMGLRIQVLPGGCSGYKYAFEIVKDAQTNDKTFNVNDVNFFIDKESLSLIKGSQVDYADGLHGAGFKISNPSANHTCGCGDSFN